MVLIGVERHGKTGLGCLQVHKDGDQYRYFHSSSNNATLFERPRLVKSEADLDGFLDDLTLKDLSLRSTLMHPNSEWRLHALANLTFYFTKLKGIGRVGNGGARLPRHVGNSKAVIDLMSDFKTGVPYDGNMCAFRCLALVQNCRCRENQCSCKRASRRETLRHISRRYRRFNGAK